MAEREGFEPSNRIAPINGLASRRLQPLGHLSLHLKDIFAGAGAAAVHHIARAPPQINNSGDSSIIIRLKQIKFLSKNPMVKNYRGNLAQ